MRLFNSNSHFGHSTFNSTFHSNIRLVNWDGTCNTNIQWKHSMETFNLNIQHSIRYSIQKFDYSIPKFNTNLQSKHSIRTFTSNIQSEHSIRTFNSNIQSKHSIQWFPGSSYQHPGRWVLERRERKGSDPEVARVAYEIFQRFQ